MPFRCRRSLLALLATSLAAGCASPGEPTARRSPTIPKAVQDLAVWQQGDSVVLTFTLPGQSVRNEPLAAPPALEIYRGATGSGGQGAEKVSTQLIYTIPGEMAHSYTENGRIVYRDRIELQELARAGGTISERVYLVRTRVERSRASAESNRAVQLIHPPPPPVTNVRAGLAQTNTEPPSIAVRLEWPRNDGDVYYLYRTEVAADDSQAVSQMPLVKLAEVRASEIATDPLMQYRDNKVELGHRYMYIIRNVLEFIGPSIVESADSQPIVITVGETIPPATPQDLEAVLVPAAPPEPVSVSLAWAIASQADVAGYVVYRSEQEGVRGERLNGQLLGSPTYRDDSVAAGRRYFYSVTAVDAAGNEGSPSAAVEAQTPGPQP